VNPQATDESLNLEIKGVTSLASTAEVITLSGSPEDTNSINRPRNVVPVTTTLHDVKPQISLNLPANSFVVVRLN
jgi:alpha-L-arabinofuranosidase